MIRKQEKPMLTPPAMSTGEYEAAVAAFIRNRGVTRCPTACLVRTQASVSAADRSGPRTIRGGTGTVAANKSGGDGQVAGGAPTAIERDAPH